MKVKVIESGKTTRHHKKTKYGILLDVMTASLKRDGADGKLRALEPTDKWPSAKLRRVAMGLRFHARIHKIPGFRLSLLTCAVNGLVFRWVKTH